MPIGWIITADKIFDLDGWKLACLVFLYIVPILKIALLPFSFRGSPAFCLGKLSGMLEHVISLPRDFIVAPMLVLGAAWHIWRSGRFLSWQEFAIALAAVSLVAIGQINRISKLKNRWRLLEFIRHFPKIHPQEFFDRLLCASGALKHKLPERPLSSINPAKLDFRNGKKKRALGPIAIARGVWSTIWLTRLIILAGRRGGDEFMREVASAFAVIWGSRIAELAMAQVTIDGKDFLPRAGGPQIFIYTHASFLDFAVAPFALAARPCSNGGVNCLPKFLIAKDHFIDNPIFYNVLGIGRAAKALGMIFVDRKAADKITAAKRVAKESAAALLGASPDIAIFPQGTRALCLKGPRGERRDAAYYTVGSQDRIRAPGGHLKKGAAHICVALADELARSGRDETIKIIPIAIAGAAIACPKGSFKIYPNARIELRVGEPILVGPSITEPENYSESVARLHTRIDCALKNLLHIHAELERRFFEDIRGMLDPMRIDEVAIAMKPWRGDDYLLHSILDAIYTCGPDLWRGFLGELIHLILNFADRKEFLTLKSKIAGLASF